VLAELAARVAVSNDENYFLHHRQSAVTYSLKDTMIILVLPKLIAPELFEPTRIHCPDA
jgi:hypothetical protein